jgi:spore coat polysaccharide biosynthesis protein SpsF (cytidylyltransferase family)
MRCAIVIQARLNSTRLPKKVLEVVDGWPMLTQLHRRVKTSKRATAVIVACPTQDLEEIEMKTGLNCYGGPEHDLITRLMGAVESVEADIMVRVTADCPLVDPGMIDNMIGLCHKAKNAGWALNWEPRKFPDGLDVDVWKVDYLKYLDKKLQGNDREYFASWCLRNHEPHMAFTNDEDHSRFARLTVDYPEDLELIRAVYAEMNGDNWSANQIMRWLSENPGIKALNAMHIGANNFGAKPE